MNEKNEKSDSSTLSKNDEILKRFENPFSQRFDSLEKTYQFDPKINKVIETGFRDVQEEINSHRECALDVMLDKFLDPRIQQPVELVEGVADVKALDLIELSEIAVKKEELCLKYGLSPYATLTQIQDVISNKIKEREVNSNEKDEIKKENE